MILAVNDRIVVHIMLRGAAGDLSRRIRTRAFNGQMPIAADAEHDSGRAESVEAQGQHRQPRRNVANPVHQFFQGNSYTNQRQTGSIIALSVPLSARNNRLFSRRAVNWQQPVDWDVQPKTNWYRTEECSERYHAIGEDSGVKEVRDNRENPAK